MLQIKNKIEYYEIIHKINHDIIYLHAKPAYQLLLKKKLHWETIKKWVRGKLDYYQPIPGKKFSIGLS